jgi:hypothetical protein
MKCVLLDIAVTFALLIGFWALVVWSDLAP